MEIIFLGTSSMVPTKERNHSAIYLDIGTTALLFDCGEATQRQIRIAGLKTQKIAALFLSHWHGDHVLGIPGLLQTMAALGHPTTLQIYGPASSKERIDYLFKTFVFDKPLAFEVIEISQEGTIAQYANYTIAAALLDHGIPTLAYRIEQQDRYKLDQQKIEQYAVPLTLRSALQEGKNITVGKQTITPAMVGSLVPGKKIVIITDTMYTSQLATFAADADILICEATYHSELEEKAFEYKHMTAAQAAQLAMQANAKQLVLTHFSSRYKEITPLLDEARLYFPNTVAAYDFMKIKL